MDRGEQAKLRCTEERERRGERRGGEPPRRKTSGGERRGEGRSRSRLMSEGAKVREQFGAADGGPG